jgi:hypothetical protein
MPRYYFHLRDGAGGVTDRQGVELHDHAAAREHAAAVGRELMRQAEAKTRHWQLDVSDRRGGVLFRLPFASVDETIGHLPGELRKQIERLCVRQRELAEAVYQARLTVLESRALVARARGKPYLVTHRFGQPVSGGLSVR